MAKRRAKKAVAPKRRQRSFGGQRRKLPTEVVTLMVILRAKPGQEGLLDAELRALIDPTRREAGCLRYDLHAAVDTPGTFLLHEVWSSREHHRLHTRTPHFLRWDARKDALLESREGTFWRQLA